MVKNSVRWVAVETFFSRGLGLLAFIIVARELGPEAMGIIALVMLIRELAVIVSEFGLTQAIIHFQKLTAAQLATLYSLNWLLGIAAYSIAFLVSKPAAQYFEEPLLSELVPVAAVAFLIAPIAQQVNTLLQKSMNFRTLAKINMIGSIASFIVAVVCVYSGLGVWSLVISGLVSICIQQSMLLFVGFREKMLHGFAWDIRSVKQVLSFGLYRTGAAGLNMLNSRIDQLVIAGGLGAAALGVYALASNLTLTTMQQLNSIATKVAFPAIARIQDDLVEVKLAYLRLVNRACTVNAGIYFGLASVSGLIIELFLGAEWGELGNILPLMCGYVLIRALGNLNGPLAMGLGKANWTFYWTLIVTAVVPITLIIVIGFGSLELIVISQIGLQLFLVVLMYFYWIRRLIGPCIVDYFRAVVIPWSCGAGMAVTLLLLQYFMKGESALSQIILLIPIGVIVYLGLSFVFNRSAIKEIISLMLYKRIKAL